MACGVHCEKVSELGPRQRLCSCGDMGAELGSFWIVVLGFTVWWVYIISSDSGDASMVFNHHESYMPC